MKNIFQSKDKNLIELLKGSSFALVLKVTGMLFSYLAMLFVTRFYGAEEWGIYSLCITVLSIAVIVPVFGFDKSIVRIITELNLSNDKNETLRVIAKASLLTIVLSVIIIFGMDSYSEFIADKILKQEGFESFLTLIRIAVVPMAFLVLISAIFQSFKKIILFMLSKSALLSVFFLIFLVSFYYLELNVSVFETYLYAIAASLIVAFIFVLLLLKSKKQGDYKPKKTYSYKNIIVLSFPMMMSSSFALLMGWIDILMLSYYRGATDIGIYNSALKLASIALIALASVNSIASPKIVEFYSKNNFQGLKDVVQKSTKIMFTVSAPLLLVLIIFPKTILSIFGPEFVSGYLVLIFLCSARFINSISGSVGHIMQMTDNQNRYQTVMVIALLINLILNLKLIPEFGINGAAFSSAIAMVFWNITLVIIIKKRLGFWTFYIPFLTK